MDIRANIPNYEKRVHSLAKPFGDMSYILKRYFTSRKFYSLEELCDIGCIDKSKLSDTIKSLFDRKITQIAQCGSRMTSNCLAVQFDEDSDEIIRWGCANGAIAAITRNQIDELPCIVVESPEEVYTKLCGYLRDKSEVEVTGVAGSIGKTSTKKMIHSVYSTYFNTFNDPENENQLPCVGYAIQHIPAKTEKQVQELSEDIPGCLDKMMRVIKPKIVAITAIDKSHIEAFGSEWAVYDEVASVLKAMPSDGVAIVNLDDVTIMKYVANCKHKTISMANPNADYYANDIRILTCGLCFNIVEKSSQQTFKVTLNSIYARHNVYSALYAFVAGVLSGVPYDKIIKGLACFKTSGIRQNVYKDIWQNNIIYADCYNAVAKSVKSAIETATEIPIKGKRIAVLGDVEEAGEFSEQTHIDIIQSVNNSTFDVLIAYGDKLSQALSVLPLRSSLFVYRCGDKKEIVALLRQLTQKGDLILFKASRKSALETIIKQVWGVTYRLKMLSYYWAVIKWRLRVIFN